MIREEEGPKRREQRWRKEEEGSGRKRKEEERRKIGKGEKRRRMAVLDYETKSEEGFARWVPGNNGGKFYGIVARNCRHAHSRGRCRNIKTEGRKAPGD